MNPGAAGDTISVGLAHASTLVRRQLEALLGPHAGVRVAFGVDEAYDALALLGKFRPAVLFAEAAQVVGASAGFVRLVRERSPRCRVLLLTAGESDEDLLDVLRHGAMGFLDPRARPDLVARAARAIAAGEAWVPRHIVARLIESLDCEAQAPPRAHPMRA
jgi:DNA-binding NarL/FixJ family response regulator